MSVSAHHVHLSRDFSASQAHELEALVSFPVSVGGEVAPETTILVDGRPDESALEFVKVVIVPFAGIPEVTRRRVSDYPSVVLHNLHFNARATGELAVALLLAAARRVVTADKLLRHGEWAWRTGDDPGVSLYGKTVCIFGYGAVGHVVGTALEALGMHILGVRSAEFGQLDTVLAESHALVVTAPLTPATSGAITLERLMLLREPRLVCNVGRGPVIDEHALFEACQTRAVAAAGIDVWYQYPTEESPTNLPSSRPFHELDNVVLSPHRAGSTAEIESERIRALADLIEALTRGEGPPPVDVNRGY